jgi:hypothetical protein
MFTSYTNVVVYCIKSIIERNQVKFTKLGLGSDEVSQWQISLLQQLYINVIKNKGAEITPPRYRRFFSLTLVPFLQ